MQELSNKSLSESNISEQTDQHTPPTHSFVFQRAKRPRGLELENDEFNAFKEEMKNMISTMMAAQHEEIKKIYPTLMEIKNTNVNIESAMAALSAQNDDLKKKIELLETQTKKDNEYIVILENKIEDLHRESRKANLEIKNVPKVAKEKKDDLIKMVTCLSNSIDCNILTRDITDIYRVQNKRSNTKNSTIVLEMGSTLLKTEFLKKTKEFNRKNTEKICAKHLGFKLEGNTPIFVSEQLTAIGSRLFFLARDLAKTRDYKFCWTAYGKVYVKKDENSPTIVIKSETQIHHLMQQK